MSFTVEEIMNDESIKPSDYLVSAMKETDGTGAAIILNATEQIGETCDVSPTDELLACAIVAALGAEAMVLAKSRGEDVFFSNVEKDGNSTKIARSVELMEYALKNIREALTK